MTWLQEYVGFEEGPDDEAKVNTIIDFWSNPCDAPWTAYAKTLYPVLGRLALIIVDTGLIDIIRAYLRPRMGLTRGHKRSKGRRRRTVPGIPGSEDLIAKLVPGKELHYGRMIGAGEDFLWTVDGLVQRGLWTFILLDIAVEGPYWWAMGIRQEGYCNPHNRPGLYATDDVPVCINFAGQWVVAGSFERQWGDPDITITQSVVGLPAGNFRLEFIATYTGVFTPTADIRVRWTGPGCNVEAHGVVNNGLPTVMSVRAGVTGPGFFEAASRFTGNLFCTASSGVIIVRRQ